MQYFVYIGKDSKTINLFSKLSIGVFYAASNCNQAIKVLDKIREKYDTALFFEQINLSQDIANIHYMRKKYPGLYMVLVIDSLSKEEAPEYLKAGINNTIKYETNPESLQALSTFLKHRKDQKIQALQLKTQNLNAFRLPLWKRAFDIVFSGMALLCLSPLLILTALAIRLESKGPIIYKSKRVGSNYLIFDFLKFRSMYTDADKHLKDFNTLNQYQQEEELRNEFLIQNLYQADEVVAVYSHVDRMVTLGCMPVTEKVSIEKGIDCWKNFGTHYFLERREIGIFNIGGKGKITADGQEYEMGYKDCLYITKGTKEVYFESEDASKPAKFYMVSAPAHTSYTTTFIPIEKAAKRPCGEAALSNKRVINQFIHPDVLKTCQLSMGMTVLEPGSVWNTMPAHTHERRMEVYMYFEVPGDNVVFHMMGEPTETRHIVMKNEEAVISPSWSIHSGAGTSNYTFIWAMGGENMEFDDMDTMKPNEMM